MSAYKSKYTGSQIDEKLRPYKVYTALLAQSGTNPPTATVLENTLGVVITWGYVTVGLYSCNASEAIFISKKTAIFVGEDYNFLIVGPPAQIQAKVANDSTIWVNVGSFIIVGSTIELQDANGQLSERVIEIRVYD